MYYELEHRALAAPRCSPKCSTSRAGMAYRRRIAPTTSLGLISTGARATKSATVVSLLGFPLWRTNCFACVRNVLAGVMSARLRCYSATQFVGWHFIISRPSTVSHGLGFRTAKDGKV